MIRIYSEHVTGYAILCIMAAKKIDVTQAQQIEPKKEGISPGTDVVEVLGPTVQPPCYGRTLSSIPSRELDTQCVSSWPL